MLETLINNCINSRFTFVAWNKLENYLRTGSNCVQDDKSKNLLGGLLFWAIYFNQGCSVIKTILCTRPSLDMCNQASGNYAVHLAISKGRTDIVRSLLTHNNILWFRKNTKNGKTALELAKLQNLYLNGVNHCYKGGFIYQKFHFHQANLYAPEPKINLSVCLGHNTLTLGDMHGSALKLIYILTIFSIWDLSSKDYGVLYAIYTNWESTQSLQDSGLECFEKIINSCKPHKIHSIKKLRFLGDMFADRGKNDYLTLLILKWLSDNWIEYEIMLSNHGLNLLYSYLGKGKLNKCVYSSPDSSLTGLKATMERLLDRDPADVKSDVKKYFLDKLKIFEAESSHHNNMTMVNIYSHAFTNFETIVAILNVFCANMLQSHPIEASVCALNANFQESLESLAGGSSSLIARVLKDLLDKNVNGALVDFTKNRDILTCLKSKGWGNYQLNFIHGHIGDQPSSIHVSQSFQSTYINLDTPLGLEKNNQIRDRGKLYFWLSLSKRSFKSLPYGPNFQCLSSTRSM